MPNVTIHWLKHKTRLELIKNVVGLGDVVETFLVDKGHPNGKELHTITTTGIIVVRNAVTGYYVTALIARPGQIFRYYNSEGRVPPEQVMNIAREHQLLGYNKV